MGVYFFWGVFSWEKLLQKVSHDSFFLGGTFAKVPPEPSSKAFEAGVRIN
jgi:hypothetical protein